MFNIHAELHISREAHVLQHATAEGYAPLVDVNDRRGIGVDIDDFEVKLREIEFHNVSFLSVVGPDTRCLASGLLGSKLSGPSWLMESTMAKNCSRSSFVQLGSIRK